MIGKMKNPPHPGGFIAEAIEETGVSVRELAKRLGVAPSTLSRLVREEIAVTPEMAIKLSVVLGLAPHIWLNAQADYSLAQAEKTVDVSHLRPLVEPDDSETAHVHH